MSSPSRPPAAGPAEVTVDTEGLWAWLSSPHLDERTVAEWIGVEEDFSWDDPGLGEILSTLLDRASEAGLLSLPDHEINLHEIRNETARRPSVEYLVTVTIPGGGLTLASPLLTADQVIGDDTRDGIDAAVSALQTIAGHVDQLLATAHDLNRPHGFIPVDAQPPHPAPDPSAPPPAAPRHPARGA